MKNRPLICVLLIAADVLLSGAYAADLDEPAVLTGEIQAMDATASARGTQVVSDKIASDFESFAGSKENSTALVTGLRTGTEITLTQVGEPSAVFAPATKPMGYGNVSTSLALAKYQLAQQGIANPTPEQLKAALDGGTITLDGRTVEYEGILRMRADGLGWGEMAQRLGTKLGPVVSGLKAQNGHIATFPLAKQAPASPALARPTRAMGARAGTSDDLRRGEASSKGIVSAAGAPVSSTEKGRHAVGVTTAAGSKPVPRGQGIVTAAGHGAVPNANGLDNGKAGIVNASGASVSASAAAGPGKGHGKALGHTK